MKSRNQKSAPFQLGFTLVELITVMVIVGIISAIALPRLFDRGSFDSRGFYDQLIFSLRYAQKSAISQRRQVCVTFPTASRMVLTTATNFGGACDTNLQNPVDQTAYIIDAPSGVTMIGAIAFSYDALGRPSFAGAAPLSIGVSGFTTNNVCIAAETGYVYGRAVC
jgi:MSHA pilin protein MshC